MGLVSEGTTGAVKIVDDYGDGGLGDSALALLVDELLEVGCANLLQIGNSQDEADGVKDVGLARPFQTRYGIENASNSSTTVLLDVHIRNGFQHEDREFPSGFFFLRLVSVAEEEIVVRIRVLWALDYEFYLDFHELSLCVSEWSSLNSTLVINNHSFIPDIFSLHQVLNSTR